MYLSVSNGSSVLSLLPVHVLSPYSFVITLNIPGRIIKCVDK